MIDVIMLIGHELNIKKMIKWYWTIVRLVEMGLTLKLDPVYILYTLEFEEDQVKINF